VVLLLRPFLLKPYQYLILGKTIDSTYLDERYSFVHKTVNGASGNLQLIPTVQLDDILPESWVASG
jgi:hypothetical protein